MLERVGMVRYALGFLVLLELVLCCSSCRTEGSPSPAHEYRLDRGGYSSGANTLLLAVYPSGDIDSRLAAYDEEKQLMLAVPQPLDSPHYFAWTPRQAVFVATWGDYRVLLYRKNASMDNYDGIPIRCPVRVSYDKCAWNPRGQWLAVVCDDMRGRGSVTKLGLYDLKEDNFVMTDVNVRTGGSLFWKDDTTLYAEKGHDGILELQLESGIPKVVRTIPVERMTSFYGMFGDRPLSRDDGGNLKLGDKTLIEVGGASHGHEVVATETTVFVSASPTNLVAFDSQGREIDRTNPGRPIHFGSIGKDQNTVYGVARSTLLRVSIVEGHLKIQEVGDLESVPYSN